MQWLLFNYNGEGEAQSHVAGDPRVSAPGRAQPPLTLNTSEPEPASAVQVPGAGALLQPHPRTEPWVRLKPQMLTLWNGISVRVQLTRLKRMFTVLMCQTCLNNFTHTTDPRMSR